MAHTDFDKRMKENYEFRSRSYLTRRVPVIIRVDGKAFHTFCKRFERPYDDFLNESLNKVMQFLCKNIQGAKFAERHSDEISILVTDFDTLQTDAYFDYNIQKICSVVASMATAEFCRILAVKQRDFESLSKSVEEIYSKRSVIGFDEDWPCFDTRCFNIPEHEVANYFWWREKDSLRNSISMLAQSKFSHGQLQSKNNSEKQEMLFSEFGINWNNLPQCQKTGCVCFRGCNEDGSRSPWIIEAAPIDKEALDNLLKKVLDFEGGWSVSEE